MPNSLRGVLGMLATVGLLIGTACSPAAAPTPTTAPAKPTVAQPPATTAPVAPTSAAAAPASKSDSAPAAKPAASANWKAEWDKTLAAAKKEGKVSVAGSQGDTYRDAAMAFQKDYPDIQLEFLGMRGPDFDPRIIAEREAGKFLWDVRIGSASSLVNNYKPKKIVDPIRPALILPEVLDSSKWVGGFEDSWIDKERQYGFIFEGSIAIMAYVNRDVVPESELNSFDQLLDPKWKGKITSLDPRVPSIATGNTGHLLMVKGEAWLRKLFAQDIVTTNDNRQLAESVIRGKYPIGMGIRKSALVPFWKEGLGQNVKPLDPNNPAAVRLNSDMGNLMFFNKAPHPNAAKVFINWLLSPEGQKAYVKATEMNSRRIDVEGPADSAPDPKAKYVLINTEENEHFPTEAINIAKEIIK